MSEVTCALAVITPSGKVLLAHPTNAGYHNAWSLPKGLKDEGEAEVDAAIRECREETGLDVLKHRAEVIDLGRHAYKRGKDLHLFALKLLYELSTAGLVCESMCGNPPFPEVDRFQVAGLEGCRLLLNKGQLKIFENTVVPLL